MNREKGSAAIKASELDPWFDPWKVFAEEESNREMASLERSLDSAKKQQRDDSPE